MSFAMLAVLVGCLPMLAQDAEKPTGELPDYETEVANSRNELMKAMTGIDPLNQGTITPAENRLLIELIT